MKTPTDWKQIVRLEFGFKCNRCECVRAVGVCVSLHSSLLLRCCKDQPPLCRLLLASSIFPVRKCIFFWEILWFPVSFQFRFHVFSFSFFVGRVRARIVYTNVRRKWSSIIDSDCLWTLLCCFFIAATLALFKIRFFMSDRNVNGFSVTAPTWSQSRRKQFCWLNSVMRLQTNEWAVFLICDTRIRLGVVWLLFAHSEWLNQRKYGRAFVEFTARVYWIVHSWQYFLEEFGTFVKCGESVVDMIISTSVYLMLVESHDFDDKKSRCLSANNAINRRRKMALAAVFGPNIPHRPAHMELCIETRGFFCRSLIKEYAITEMLTYGM